MGILALQELLAKVPLMVIQPTRSGLLTSKSFARISFIWNVCN